MQFSEKQSRVLAAIIHSPECDIKKVAKIAGVKEHAVRYLHDQLVDRDILDPFYVINLPRVGLRPYNLFFSIAVTHAREVTAFIIRDPRVIWFTEKTGSPRYEATLAINDPLELAQFFRHIGEKTGAFLEDRRWSVETNYYYFGNRILNPRIKSPIYRFVEKPREQKFNFTALDLKLIDIHRKYPRDRAQSINEMARELRVPVSTVAYHLKKLFSEQVLTPRLYTLRAEATGLFDCQIVLSLRTSRPEFFKELLLFCGSHPEITTLLECIGSWDYKLILLARSASDALTVKDHLETTFQGIFSEVMLLTNRRIISGITALQNHPELAEAP